MHNARLWRAEMSGRPGPRRESEAIARYGPPVDAQTLFELLTPELEKVGRKKFCSRVGISLRQLARYENGHEQPRLKLADKLLTRGLGRPDLLDDVCPLE